MNGKTRCKILKEIRQKIADENDIPYVTAECTHKGECRGTCPRCEAELRYLEQELEKRRGMGKRVAVAAVAAGMAVTTTGCAPLAAIVREAMKTPEPYEQLMGEIEIDGMIDVYDPDAAEQAQPDEDASEAGLMPLSGDVSYCPVEE